ncbi:hypothetical protein JCM19274_433 [Algibacter lectus]|uniref:Uncharacterized protein n=1 Tax=Algibacter lectus TaxID=221126 RepID=A0A090WZA4_9FLAO|nr:hypothetical protein JCM19274_433 [Algibacter lectus]
MLGLLAFINNINICQLAILDMAQRKTFFLFIFAFQIWQ